MAKTTPTQVLLFYPNLIGYLRIALMVLSFYFAKEDPKTSVLCYLGAFGGDVVDGYVARFFNQSSKFGAVLDMVTDRVSTAGVIVTLATLYPAYSFVFTMLVVLDIGSHWFHVVSVSEKHHKSKEALQKRNPLLQWYYSIYPLFGYCCVGAELFYVSLYYYYFFPSPLVYQLCFYACLPACVLKNIINLVQWWDAMVSLASEDAESRNATK